MSKQITNVKRRAWVFIGITAIAITALNVFAQELETASVPVRVDMAATVTIQPDAGVLGTGASKVLAANVTDTLNILIASGGTSITYGPRHRDVPAAVSYGRGGALLTLRPQAFGNADVSLFSVNGKRILRGKAPASDAGGVRLSRANVTAGVYLLSVKGTDGNSFSAKVNHRGGDVHINVAFGGADYSLYKKTESAGAAAVGGWSITATANADGGNSVSRTFTPKAGLNDLIELSLAKASGSENTVTVQFTSSSSAQGTVSAATTG